MNLLTCLLSYWLPVYHTHDPLHRPTPAGHDPRPGRHPLRDLCTGASLPSDPCRATSGERTTDTLCDAFMRATASISRSLSSSPSISRHLPRQPRQFVPLWPAGDRSAGGAAAGDHRAGPGRVSHRHRFGVLLGTISAIRRNSAVEWPPCSGPTWVSPCRSLAGADARVSSPRFC